MTLVARILVDRRELVSTLVFAFSFGDRLAVGVAVHEVTAGSQNLLVADVEIDTERLRSCYAVIATEATETLSVAIGESELVYIVEIAEESNLIVVPEAVDIEIGIVAVIGTISDFGVTEPSILHALFHSEVNNSFILTVIHSRHAGEVALAIHNLKFINHIHR